MAKPALPMEGGCRCGQVRFRIDAAPLVTMACHCRGCQRMTASAFSLSVMTTAKAFAVTQGEPVVGGLHGPTRHFFCAHCMSWMFTRPEDVDWIVNVRATLLDDPSWFSPFMETFTNEKLPWVRTPATHSYAEFPPMEVYADLLKAYAEAP